MQLNIQPHWTDPISMSVRSAVLLFLMRVYICIMHMIIVETKVAIPRIEMGSKKKR